ncbi:hypothetical protein ACIP20_11710 [Marinilactibacillus psychrotolerans]
MKDQDVKKIFKTFLAKTKKLDLIILKNIEEEKMIGKYSIVLQKIIQI